MLFTTTKITTRRRRYCVVLPTIIVFATIYFILVHKISFDLKNYQNNLTSTNYGDHPTTATITTKKKKKNKQKNKQKKKKKNKFIAIHIGPHKTGTTSIQHDSTGHLKTYKKALKEDHVVYIGRDARIAPSPPQRKKLIKRIFSCMVQTYNENENDFSSKYYNDNVITVDDDEDDDEVEVDNDEDDVDDDDEEDLDNDDNEYDETQKLRLQRLLLDECVPKQYQFIFQYNILESDESNSKFMPEYFQNNNDNDIFDYMNTIQQKILFDIFDYTEILVIGVYRPYAERLISSYKEYTKVSCLSVKREKEKCLNIWNDFIMKFVSKKKVDDYRSHMKKFQYNTNIDNTLLNLIPKYAPYAKIKILYYFVLKEEAQQQQQIVDNNSNNYGSITTDLYCNGLGVDRTPKTCQVSKENDLLVQHEKQIQNVGYSSASIYYHDIIYKGIQKSKHSNWSDGSTTNTKEDISSLLSSLTTAAYNNKNNNTTATARSVPPPPPATATATWSQLEQYHTKILGMNAKNNLPLLCPTKNQLEMVLEKSLQFEEKIFNNTISPLPLPASSSSSSSSLLLKTATTTTIEQQQQQLKQLKQRIKEQHIQNFWKLSLEKKSFCSLDVQKLFSDKVSSWEQLFNERLRIETW